MEHDSTAESPTQQPERVERTTKSPLDDQIKKLMQLFPECVSEGQIDFEHLKALLGEELTGADAYRLTWAGKQEAFRLVQAPSHGTLLVDDDNSVAFEYSENLFIEGENLEVLKTLYKSYYGRVKMIYIDPPYNTGGDFIYSDNFSQSLDEYLKATGQRDGEGNLLLSNPETSGRFHSSWLSMMYPRLFMARQFLRDDGVIFVSIDDNEVHNLRLLMNEVFGEENFVTTIIWQKVYSPKNSAKYFSEDHDYVVVYARNKERWRPNLLPRSEEANSRYSNPDNDPRGRWKAENPTGRNAYREGQYEVVSPTGKVFTPPRGRYWVISEEKFLKLDEENRIWWGADKNNMPAFKKFLTEVQQGIVPQTLWTYEEVGHTQEAKRELLNWVEFEHTENMFNTIKPPRLIQRMLEIATNPRSNDIVLDFFAGSGSTAQAVIEQNAKDAGNRRFICVQFPEPLPLPETKLKTIADIARERLVNLGRAIDEDGQQLLLGETEGIDLDTGFKAFRLADSTLKRWRGPSGDDPSALMEQMEVFDEGIKEDVRHRDVLYELILREGYSLNAEIETIQWGDNTVYRIEELQLQLDVTEDLEGHLDREGTRRFYVCLDEKVAFESLDDMELEADEVFICRDSALSDALKVNLSLECVLKVI